MKKIPIDEHEEGNCCPECGSTRITMSEQRCLEVSVNLSNDRPFIMRNGKMKYMTQREKAHAFDCASVAGGGLWMYKCRKCGWESETFTE